MEQKNIEMQKDKEQDVKIKFSNAFRDIIILCLVVISVFVLSYFFNIFNFLVAVFYQNPKAIIYIDEIIAVLLTLSAGLAIFSWRRWRELKKESARRIRNQEILRESAETKAEVERIISKQLRNDMDQIKHEVQQILSLLLRKNKE